jgi:hypothetical protein
MPSTSISTGAFPLPLLASHLSISRTVPHAPNLQRPRAQHARPLVLCHVWRGGAFMVFHLLQLLALDCVLLLAFCGGCRTCVAGDDDVVLGVVGLGVVAAGVILVVVEDFGLFFLVEVDVAAVTGLVSERTLRLYSMGARTSRRRHHRSRRRRRSRTFCGSFECVG